MRKGGKSATVGYATEWYYEQGYLTLDLWAAQDFENAFWCLADLYFVRWDALPGKHELRFAKFCRMKLGIGWITLAKDKNKKLQKTYTCEKIDEFTVIFRPLVGTNRYVLVKLGPDKTTATVNFPGSEKFPRSLTNFNMGTDINGNLRIIMSNPLRRDNRALMKVGHPVLIIVPESTKIIQPTPLCVCGRPIRDHPQNVNVAQAGGAQQQVTVTEQSYPCHYRNMQLIKTILDTVPLEEIVKLAMKENRIVIINRAFYSFSERSRPYAKVHEYLEQIPYLINRRVIPPSKNIALVLRELSSLVPANLKAMGGSRGKDITDVKRTLQEFIKIARHMRTTIITDYQAGDEVLGSVIDKKDYLIVKRSTKDIMPDSHKWFHDEIRNLHYTASEGDDDQVWPYVENLKPWQAYVIFPEGEPRYQLRTTLLPKAKHKEPYDDWQTLANCEVIIDEKHITASKKSKSGKVRTEADTLRDRAFTKIHELKQKHPDFSWDELIKTTGLLDKAGNAATTDGARMGYNRWLKEKAEVAADVEDVDQEAEE